jgi:hypothetical protein
MPQFHHLPLSGLSKPLLASKRQAAIHHVHQATLYSIQEVVSAAAGYTPAIVRFIVLCPPETLQHPFC